MNKAFSILLLSAASVAAAAPASVAASFAETISAPAKTATCKKDPQGQACRWKANKQFASVNSLSRGKDNFVFIINAPTFELSAFGGGQQPARNGWLKVTQGPLKGVYVRTVSFPTARHRQFELRSAAAYGQESQ